ncbi:MAG: heme exporter protein CcmD [Methylococcales bacterium]|mgnify:CR=1 FL=1|jgi:heme exporter protein CcmD|nr:heme exporter protein CcmD [Methylococcales bacterium]MBT7442844.1 heme exporter protein CcmD [Methylococcales bacterium]
MSFFELLATDKHLGYIVASYAITFVFVVGYIIHTLWLGKNVRQKLVRRIKARRKNDDATA